MTKSPPRPCVCFWTCQNGREAKSILIMLVFRSHPRNGVTLRVRVMEPQGSRETVCLGPWGDQIVGQFGSHHVWALWPSECPASSELGGFGEGKHSKDIDDTVLLPLRCSHHILEDMMSVHAHNFRTLIFIHKHYRVLTMCWVLGELK